MPTEVAIEEQAVESVPVAESVDVRGEPQAAAGGAAAEGGGEEIAVDVNAGENEADQDGGPRRLLPDPGQPTARQREEHRIDHWPYRSWCPPCVAGRCTGEHHRGIPDERKTYPMLCFDYLFFTKNKKMVCKKDLMDSDEVELKVLVAKERKSKAIFAHAVDAKGSGEDGYVVNRLVEDVHWLGWTKMLLKTDNEPAIVQVLKDTLTTTRVEVPHMEQISEEHGARYDSASNGEAESAVKQIQRMTRTLKLCLESRLKRRIPTNHAIMTWLVEHVAWILCTRSRGEDGKTAYERIKGREFGKRGVGFAEKVWHVLPRKGPELEDKAKLDALCKEGIVLGYCRDSPEYHVYDLEEHKMIKARSIKRMPIEDRWDAEALEKIEIRMKRIYEPKAARGVRTEGFIEDESIEQAPRGKSRVQRVALYEKDYLEFGITDDCRKCISNKKYGYNKNASGKSSTMPHTERCRKRMEAALATTEEGRQRLARAQERVDSWIAKEIEQADGRKDVRPEGEMSGDVPNIGVPPPHDPHDLDDLFGDFDDRAKQTQAKEAEEQFETERDAFLDGFIERDGQATPVATPTGDADMGDGDFLYEPVSPRGPDEDGDTEMAANLETPDEILMLLDKCRPQAQEQIQRDAEEILQIIRDLGGSCTAYKRERKKFINHIVAEIYSAPRVTKVLKMLPNHAIAPGFALDLTTVNAKGEAWDFDKAEKRQEARELVDEVKPMFLIGSPMCSPWSSLQKLSENRRDPEDVEKMKVRAELHIRFVCELYRAQHEAGRYFLHEHPLFATSWQNEHIVGILRLDGVDTVWGDQCQYGQQAGTEGPVKKPTRWLSNSVGILKKLDTKCRGRGGYCSRAQGGKHVSCEGQVARRAAEYPMALCKAILQGCRNQLRMDGRWRYGFIGILPQDDEYMTEAKVKRRIERIYHVNFEEGKEETFIDSVTGKPLVAALVREARKKELEYFNAMTVWTKRKRREAFERQGKPPITVRWVDTNKGDDTCPNYRSRLVAREIRRHGEDPIFAPTPPLESLRTILSIAASNLPGKKPHIRDPESEHRTQVSFIDIKRAYLTAPTDPNDPTYVELPPEDKDHGSDWCALLLKHMYGTRKAGDGWHVEVSGTLVDKLGFTKGCASACVFRHPSREIECSIHGDDLTATGSKVQLDWYRDQLKEAYGLEESARLGPGKDDDKEARMLNRVIRWTPEGLEYEEDPRLHEQIASDLGLVGCKGVGTPGVKPTFEQIEGDEELQSKKEKPYRAIAARMNYLAADRPDIQYSAKEIGCGWLVPLSWDL